MHKTFTAMDLDFQVQFEFWVSRLFFYAANPIIAPRESTFKLKTRFTRNGILNLLAKITE